VTFSGALEWVDERDQGQRLVSAEVVIAFSIVLGALMGSRDLLRLLLLGSQAMAGVGHTPEEPLVTRCAWCERYEIENRWSTRRPSTLSRKLGTWASTMASHGICPDCTADLKQRGLSV
jgi:hypothetical protein